MRRHPHNQVTGLQAGFLHNCLASYSMHLLSAPSRISLQVTITKPNVTSLIVFQLHQELQRLRPGPTQKPKGTPRVSVQNCLCSLIDALPISVSCFPTQPALSPIQQHPASGKAQITYSSYLSENCLNVVWYLVSVLEHPTWSDFHFP